MPSDDLVAGYRLLKTGALVDFKILNEEILVGSDAAEFAVHVELSMEADDDGDPADAAAWGAFGFTFVLAVLSFNDARARGASLQDYEEKDQFRVSDLFEGIRYENGELHDYGDYIRGRRMKTGIVVRANGTVRLETLGRGKAALGWLARLQGKKLMEVLDTDA